MEYLLIVTAEISACCPECVQNQEVLTAQFATDGHLFTQSN